MRFHSRHHSSSECHPEVLTPGGRIFQAWLTSIRAKCAAATNQLMSVTKRNARTETCSDTPIDAMHYQNLNFRRYLKTINACHGSGLLLPRSFLRPPDTLFFSATSNLFSVRGPYLVFGVFHNLHCVICCQIHLVEMPFVRRLGPFRETNNDFPSAEMQPLYPSVDADSFKSGTSSLQGVFGVIFGVIA